MKILVTGGTGFLGRNLIKHFLHSRNFVALVTRDPKKVKKLNFCDHENLNVIDSSSLFSLKEGFKFFNPDIIIHTACCYGRKNEDDNSMFESNYKFGVDIFNLANDNSKKVFINIGTSLERHINTYSLLKHQFVEFCKSASEKDIKFKFINIKLEHMYGPGDEESKFTAYILNSCLKNVESIDLTHGNQTRDMIYIDDVISAIQAIINNIKDLKNNEDLSLGFGVKTSIQDFVRKVAHLSGSKTKLNFGALDYRENETMHSVADISRLKQFGWLPKYDLDKGIQDYIEKEKKL